MPGHTCRRSRPAARCRRPPLAGCRAADRHGRSGGLPGPGSGPRNGRPGDRRRSGPHGCHRAKRTGRRPPTEITVIFGVQVGQDLKLGIVNGSGQAHLTVTATWRPDGADGGAAS
ncbi:CU044_2847 family protein [Streptomyces sp. DSM 118878]